MPNAGFVWDSAGNLYGTAAGGGEGGSGINGQGLIFKLDAHGKETVLYEFDGAQSGGQPASGLIFDDAGNLYGTTPYDGSESCGLSGIECGVVFKLNQAGKETNFHTFVQQRNGANPSTGLIRDTAGNFFGGTSFGGIGNCGGDGQGCGVVFELDANGRETTLYRFRGGYDGESPSSLLIDAAGDLYGTTTAGGGPGYCRFESCGVVFKLESIGKVKILNSFTDPSLGLGPVGLVMGPDGALYGATTSGGTDGAGVIFKITP